MTFPITKTKEPLVPPPDCYEEVGPLDGASGESTQIKSLLPSFWRYATGPGAALFRLLYEKGIVDSEGELTRGDKLHPDYANTLLPYLPENLTMQLRNHLDKRFRVVVGDEEKWTSITELLDKFRANLPPQFSIANIRFCGSYLPYFFLFEAEGYFDRLFADFPPEALTLMKEIALSTPNDIDLRVKIEGASGLTTEEIKKKIRAVFLSPLGAYEDIRFRKLATPNNGIDRFQLIQFEETDVELSLCLDLHRDYLFARDSYYCAVSSSSPKSHFSSSRQGLIDIFLGVDRTETPEEIVDGYLRLISRITKGDLSIQRGLTKILASHFVKEMDQCVRCITASSLNHHANDPLETFVFLWNFSHFASLHHEIVRELWTRFYKLNKKPTEKWAAQVIEMISEKALPFEEVSSTMHSALFLCAATERSKGMTVDLGCFELDRPVLMARVETATLHMLYDPTREMSCNKEHLKLLHTIFPCDQRYNLRKIPLKAMGGLPKLGLLSCFFIEDPLERLQALVTGVRDANVSANFVASLALSTISNNNFAKAKTNKTVSQGLVYLVKMAESSKAATLLMKKGCASGLIMESSPERTMGRLHVSCSSENFSPQERIKRCKELTDRGEVSSSKQVDEMFSPLLIQQGGNQSFQQVQEWLSKVPLTREGRNDVTADLVRKYLNENKRKEAQRALISFLETSNSDAQSKRLLDHFVGTFLRLEEKSWSNFCMVERVLQKASPLCCDTSLLARYFVASLQLSQTRRWSLSCHHLPLLLRHHGALPDGFSSFFIPVIANEILLKGSPYSAHKNFLENFIESCVPQLHMSKDLHTCFSVFDAAETSKLQFTWSCEIDSAWQACTKEVLSQPSPNLDRVDAVMHLPQQCGEDSTTPEILWVLLGKRWLQKDEQKKLLKCVEHVSSIENVEFLWEAYAFYMKNRNDQSAIAVLEKIFQLDPKSIERIWSAYSHCLRELCDLPTQAALLRSSLVVRRANGSVGLMVQECSKKLLESRNQFEHICAHDLLLAFSSQLIDVEPAVWLKLLQQLQKNGRDRVWSALQKMDHQLVAHEKVRREAWMIGLKCVTRRDEGSLLSWFQQTTTFPATDTLFVDQLVDSVITAVRTRKPTEVAATLTHLANTPHLSLSSNVSVATAMLHSKDSSIRDDGHERLKGILESSDKTKLASIIPSLTDRLLPLPTPQIKLLMKVCTLSYYREIQLNNIPAVFAVFFPGNSSHDFSAEDVLFLLQFLSSALHGNRFPAHRNSNPTLLTAIRTLYATLKIYPELRSDPRTGELINAILCSQVVQKVAPRAFLESIKGDYLCFLLRSESLSSAEKLSVFGLACQTCSVTGGVGEYIDTIVPLTFDLLLNWVKDESIDYIATQEKLGAFFKVLEQMRDNKKIDKKNARVRFSKWVSGFVRESCSLPVTTPHFREHMDTVGHCLTKFMQDYSKETSLILELLELYTRKRVLVPSDQLLIIIDLAVRERIFHNTPLKKGMLFLYNYHQRSADAQKKRPIPPGVAVDYYNTLVTNYLSVKQFKEAFHVLVGNDSILTMYSHEGPDSYYTAPFAAFVEAAKTSSQFEDFVTGYVAALNKFAAEKRVGSVRMVSQRERHQKQEVFSLFFNGAIDHYFRSEFAVPSDDKRYEANVKKCLYLLYQQYYNSWFVDNPSALLEMTEQMIPFVVPLNRNFSTYSQTLDIGFQLSNFIKFIPDRDEKDVLESQAHVITSRWLSEVYDTSYNKTPVNLAAKK